MQAAHAAQYQKNKQPNQKLGRSPNSHFSEEDIQMAYKLMKKKKSSTLLINREI